MGRSAPGAAADEPTQLLPVVAPSRSLKPPLKPPSNPPMKPPLGPPLGPPPRVAARAVIVYAEQPRRPWRLCAFTAVLVALTVGVVLGQAEAFERTYRSTASAQTVMVPPATAAVAGPAEAPWPDAEHRVTAPLTSVRTRILEVAGASTVLRVRSVDLGETLLDVATTDRSAVPRLTDTGQGSRLDLVPTGASGTVGAEIQLNRKVAWTLKLTGGSSEQYVDMLAGGLAGIAIGGGTGHVELHLPKPKRSVRLTVTGPVRELTVRTSAGVRLRLAAGADTAVVDGKTRRNVKAGTALTSAGWRSARNRYEITCSDAVSAVLAATS
jgi:hypothetical protein